MRSVTFVHAGWMAGLLALPALLPAQTVAQRLRASVWVDTAGPLPRAVELIAVLEAAGADGLRPEDYDPAGLRRMLDRRTPAALADLDVRLTEVFLRFGIELARGRVDPAMTDTLWSGARDSADVWAALEAAGRSDRGGVAEALHALRPPQTGYALLRLTLAWYRSIAAAGGWGTVAGGPALTLGAQGEQVARLRARLAATGDLVVPRGAADEPFDSTLEAAVRRFQARHGLRPDGVVAAATLVELNVPVADRIRQMEMNLERWRWLPRDLGRRYAMVNIAAFALDVREDDRSVLAMPVVVGRRDWETPIVSATATQLVFGPPWNVPRSIAVQEILPVVQRDPGLPVRQGIHVFTDSTPSREIAADSVDWTTVTESTFAYRLVQAPGPGNPLGGAKVVFPNRFDVAAHDTPDHTLFTNDVRVASHGCVRLSNAAALVGYLLRTAPRWTADSIRAAMGRPVERWITLPEPLPVHLAYWTAWVDDDGVVQFRPDVYGWDARLAAALGLDPTRRATAPRSP